MQQLISRFGGTPALILKILFLGVVNGATIWAIPPLLRTQNWIMLAVLLIATAALDFLFLTKRYIPAKYVVIGAVFLSVFQIIPIIYTVSIAFTNYSTGHIGTKEDAIESISRDSLTEAENSTQYEMLPAYDEANNLVLILTAVPGTGPGAATDAAVIEEPAAEGEVQTDFGPGEVASAEPDVQTDFGPGEVSASAPAEPDSASTDMNQPIGGVDGELPPTYIGTDAGIDEVPSGDVQRDEFGVVTGVTGYTVVPDADIPGLDATLAAIRIPGPQGGYIVPQGLGAAIELEPVVVYDSASDTFTNVDTGVVYRDNGRGSFVDPDNPDDELLPGWKTSVGWGNFTQILTDPDIRQPFGFVFVWTFAYAFLTVAITFFLGLGLAMTLNRPSMKGQKVYRSLLIIPYAVPAFLSVLVWGGLLNDDFGALNSVLGVQIPWLFDPYWAKVSALLVNVWLGLPYMFLISTGALQAIPSELQEAARVDGARSWQVFRLVNLPLLLVALTPLLVASFAFNFNNFNNIYLLTGGGPAVEGSNVAGATDILISYTYKIAFAAGKGNDYGLASAISIIIFLIVGTISAISFARSKALREERA